MPLTKIAQQSYLECTYHDCDRREQEIKCAL